MPSPRETRKKQARPVKKSRVHAKRVKKAAHKERLVLAYDLGGTKVAVGVVNQNGKILTYTREPALIKKGKKETLDQLIRLGKDLIAKYPKILRVGVASAGPLDIEKGILLDPTNFQSPDGPWGNVPLTQILEKGLKRKVTLENDAAAAILAEHWMGHARGVKNAMVLTLGTGLGTGIICNGALVRSGRNMHTEGGHLILKANDESAPCGCGNFGCAEAYLAGRTFAHRARKVLKNDLIDAPQVAQRARSGDPEALALFDEYAEMMAIALHNFAVIYSPEVVVLTGSFAAASDLFLKNTEKRLDLLLSRRNAAMKLSPKILISKLENQAGLLGGAYVAFQAMK